MTDDQRAQIHAHFETIGKSCNKDSTMITDDDIANLRARKIPTGPNASCFLACMMKQIGIVSIADSLVIFSESLKNYMFVTKLIMSLDHKKLTVIKIKADITVQIKK